MATSPYDMQRPQPRSAEARRCILLDGNPGKKGIEDLLSGFLPWAAEAGHCIVLAPSIMGYASNVMERKKLDRSGFHTLEEFERRREEFSLEAGLIICLGGDGALLHSVRVYYDYGMPFLSVNLGSVGFNSTVLPDGLESAVKAWLTGRTRIVEHMILKVRLVRGGRVERDSLALNELTIHRELDSRMLEVKLLQGERRVFTTQLDGLIVSTATGSTAWNLSTGGPLVQPDLRVFIVSGIGMHTLNSRAIVLDPTALELKILPGRGDWQAAAYLDGQEKWELRQDDRLVIEEAERPLRLVNTGENRYFDALREKLNWCRPIKPLSDPEG